MSNWAIVVPVETTNLLSDPSFEVADPDTVWTFAGDGGEDFTKSTAYQFAGAGSALPNLGGGTYAAIYQAITVAEVPHTLSCYVWKATPLTSEDVTAYWRGASAAWDSITSVGGNWYRCVKTATPAAGARDMGVYCKTASIQVDAVQLEALAYATTYCDGDQEGCRWTGTPHQSTSVRDGQSRAGGRVLDFDAYETYVSGWTGAGMPPVRVNTIGRGMLPGEQYVDSHAESRRLVLNIWAKGTSVANLHAVRQDLVDAIKPDLVQPSQEFWVRYTGAAVHRQIRCAYEAGLEGGEWAGFTEKLALVLRACDPMWTAVAESAAALDTADVQSCGILIARRYGAWELFGPPDAAGTYTWLESIVRGLDGIVYMGGDFLNFHNIAAADYVAKWSPVTRVWTALGSGGNGRVLALAVDSVGDIWAGGAFTAMGGVAATSGLAKWDVSAGAWAEIGHCDYGGSAVGQVNTILLTRDGRVYIGGLFDHVNDVAAANIAYYDGTWHAIGAGADDEVRALALHPNDVIFVGGEFANAGGAAAAYIAKLDGSTWGTLGAGLSDDCFALAMAPDGTLYAGGPFHTAGGVTVNHVAAWNGTGWSDLDGGTGDIVQCLAYNPGEHVLYAGGAFTTAGDDDLPDGIAKWNGTSWAHYDLDLVGFTSVRALYVDVDGCTYVGTDGTSINVSGDTTVTNGGTATAWPVLEFSRSGGTSAVMMGLRNETTGREIVMDYALVDGETLTLDLRPEYKTVTSNIYGSRLDAVLPGGDFANWGLAPGANLITCLIMEAGSPTLTATCRWHDTFWSSD